MGKMLTERIKNNAKRLGLIGMMGLSGCFQIALDIPLKGASTESSSAEEMAGKNSTISPKEKEIKLQYFRLGLPGVRAYDGGIYKTKDGESLFDGEGVLTYNDGSVLRGHWVRGYWAGATVEDYQRKKKELGCE
jgi:hypothetical protein